MIFTVFTGVEIVKVDSAVLNMLFLIGKSRICDNIYIEIVKDKLQNNKFSNSCRGWLL